MRWRKGSIRLLTVWLLVALLAACVNAGTETDESSPPAQQPVPPTSTASTAPSTTMAAEEVTTTRSSSASPTTAASSVVGPLGSVDCPSEVHSPEGQGVTAETILEVGELRVLAARYPHPDYKGNPWSQWGRGVLTEDGRFLSAIGDHLGRDGNSFFYEFDPRSSRLSLVGDVLSVLDHRPGDWGYGKIHGALIRDGCQVYAATYWGSREGLEYGGSYQGDHLLRWDPYSHHIETLGVAIERLGIPSLAGFDAANSLYGEALHPQNKDKAFFAYDLDNNRMTFTSTDTPHVGLRDVIVAADGTAYFSAGKGKLFAYHPESEELEMHPQRLPGAWLRASTSPDEDGTLYGVTREPDRLFAMDRSGNVRDLGPAPGYVASVALDAERRRLYLMPHAHGRAWEDGAPVIAADTGTGEQDVLLELEDAVEEHFGLRVGGTYNIVFDEAGRRLYLGLNAGPLTEPEQGFGEVVLVVIEMP